MKNNHSSEELVGLMFSISLVIKEEVKTHRHCDKLSPAHIHLLKFINEKESPTMKEISEYLLVSAPSATSFIETLIKEGYLKRVLDENDRRVVRVTLTAKGKQEIDNIINAVKSHMAKTLDRLSEKEREDFRKVLQSLLKNLNN